MPAVVVPHRRDGEEVRFTAALSAASQHPHTDPSEVLVVHEGLSLPELVGLEILDSEESLVCGLHLGDQPRARRQTLALLSQHTTAAVVGVDLPVAAFARQWSHSPRVNADAPLRVVAIDRNGSLDVVIGHTGLKRLLKIGIAETAEDLETMVVQALRSSQSSTDAIVEAAQPWAETMDFVDAVEVIDLSGGRPTHLAEERFGARVTRLEGTGPLLAGLSALAGLREWTTTWPTTRFHLGRGWTRQPGPLRATVEEHLTRLRPGSDISFSDTDGFPVAVKAGSVQAEGCVIPERLGTQPRLRLIDDGRLLMLGPQGTRPLAIQLGWPVPASGRHTIDVRSAATGGGVELARLLPMTAPTVSLFPENVGDINP